MTDTIDAVAADELVDQQQLAEQLLAQARAQGIDLVGPGGLLNQITKRVLETALEAEMSEHLGYDKHDSAGRDGGNSRNGVRSKTVLTEIGPVEIDVPRDTDASFDPQIVKKRQRRLTGVDEIVLSLTARGLTTGEISAHFAEVYGASVSKDTISKITDKVVEEMTEWFNRPLDRGLPGDLHRRDRGQGPRRAGPQQTDLRRHRRHRQTANATSSAVGRRRRRGREVLAAGAHRDEEPRRRRRVHRRLRRPERPPGRDQHRVGTRHGAAVHHPPDPQHVPVRVAEVLGPDRPRPPTRSTPPRRRAEAWPRFEEFSEKWGNPYPAITRLWHNAWSEFVPFLDYDVEIRRIICSTNAIESLNARYRRAVRARGHFPNEQAALKCLYLVTRSLDPTGKGRARWAMRWKPALNAFAITFEGRITPGQ